MFVRALGAPSADGESVDVTGTTCGQDVSGLYTMDELMEKVT